MATDDRDTLKARWRRFIEINRRDAINRYDDWQSRWRDIYLSFAADAYDEHDAMRRTHQWKTHKQHDDG